MSELTPLFFDAALKGLALLVVTAMLATALFKASAATRHFVWLVGIVGVLLVPVLSLTLPKWRLLPMWKANPIVESIAPPARVQVNPIIPESKGARSADALPRLSITNAPESTHIETPPTAETFMVSSMPEISSIPEGRRNGWWIPWVWLVGFAAISLRLLMGHFLMRRIASRRCVLAEDESLREVFESCRAEMGVRQSVTLLLDLKRTIPLVWGIVRPRLLLPTEALEWDGDRLRSVLLHELAHIKRRDTLSQLLAQVACAMHWWNPLVWLASWRLFIERERACDDLVLTNGIRPSAYAEHLLHVATRLSPSPWTQGCGIAMARRSSLEGRLLAVLSRNLNRRRVSRTLASAVVILGAAIAIPLAMLRAQDVKPDETTISSQDTGIQPDHEYAQPLFEKWQGYARTDGKIPGALIAQLAREIDKHIEQYPQDEATPKLIALRPRLESTRDWTQKDVVDLLNDVTMISTSPVTWVDLFTRDFSAMKGILHGEPLPNELTFAPWGKPAANGLRAAWVLEPHMEQYSPGAVLKSRVFVHNSGRSPVIFRTKMWHHWAPHTARDSKGNKIKVRITGISPMKAIATYRLEPGEYCQLEGDGMAVGSGLYSEERRSGLVSAVIEADENDEVIFSSSVDVSLGGWTLPDDPKNSAALSMKMIAERIANEAPIPSNAADREQIVRQVTLELFGELPTPKEIAAFVDDDSPNALAKLTERLQARPRLERFIGDLPTGEVTFHVITPDQPERVRRTANGPGRYKLGTNAELIVNHLVEGERKTNVAHLEVVGGPAIEPYQIALPENGIYGFGWEVNSDVIWLLTASSVKRYDYADPRGVTESTLKLSDTNQREISSLKTQLVYAFDRAANAVVGYWPFPSKLLPSAHLIDSNSDREAALAAAEIYWGVHIEETGMDYNPGKPFDPEELARLAKAPEYIVDASTGTNFRDVAERKRMRRLSWLISRAGAEKATRFRYLLKDDELKKDKSVALALAGYDYAVNGNQEALQFILDSLAEERNGSDAQELCALGFTDEWDVTIAAYEEHFSSGTDGAGGISAGIFWANRQCLFPEQFDQFQARKRESEESD